MVYVVLNLYLKDNCANFFRLKYKLESVDQVNKAAMYKLSTASWTYGHCHQVLFLPSSGFQLNIIRLELHKN